MNAQQLPQVKNININLDLIPSVLYLELDEKEKWINIGLDQVEEKYYPELLLEGLRGDTEVSVTTEKLFLVKANEGVAEALFGASLFRASKDSKDLVIKFGENIFPVKVTGKTIHVGDFTGEFQWQSKETSAGVPYQYCVLELVSDDNPYLYFNIPIAWLKDLKILKPQFNAAFNTELGIAQYLKVHDEVTFTQCYNLEDLPLGEYAITSLERLKKTDTTYGLFCYKIHLAIGIPVWARGNSQTQLSQDVDEKGQGESNKKFDVLSAKIESGEPYKLKIIAKEEYENRGEKRVNVRHSIVRGEVKGLSPEIPMKVIEQAPEKESFDWVKEAVGLGLSPHVIQEIAEKDVPNLVAEIPETLSSKQKQDLFQAKVKSLLETKVVSEVTTFEPLVLPF